MPVGVFTMGWIGSVALAVFTALDRPEYELRPYNRGLVYAGLLVFVYVVFPVATTDGARRAGCWPATASARRSRWPRGARGWRRCGPARASAGTAVADSMVEIPNLEIATPPDPEVRPATRPR